MSATDSATPGPQGPTGIDAPDSLTAQEQAEAQAFLSKIADHWGLVFALGLVSVLAGIVILAAPFAAVRVAAFIFGVWLLVSGIFQLAESFSARLETSARVLSAISGFLGIILGIICFKSVDNRIQLLVLFIGIWWIMRGIMQIFAGAGKGGSGFLVFLGILGVIAGIVVLTWPVNSLSVLVWLTGIWLLVLGFFEVIASFRIKSLDKVDLAKI